MNWVQWCGAVCGNQQQRGQRLGRQDVLTLPSSVLPGCLAALLYGCTLPTPLRIRNYSIRQFYWYSPSSSSCVLELKIEELDDAGKVIDTPGNSLNMMEMGSKEDPHFNINPLLAHLKDLFK